MPCFRDRAEARGIAQSRQQLCPQGVYRDARGTRNGRQELCCGDGTASASRHDSPRSAPLAGTKQGDETGHQTRRSEEHTSELQSLMRNSYAVFCLKKKKKVNT